MIYLLNRILNKEWILPLKIWRIVFWFDWKLYHRKLSKKQYIEMRLKKNVLGKERYESNN